MPSIGILITSRNNYEFTDKYWVPNIRSNNDIDKFYMSQIHIIFYRKIDSILNKRICFRQIA